MSLLRFLILQLLMVCSVSGCAADSVTPRPENIVDGFFAALPGHWDGRAIETPVGPVDYAINFHVCDQGVIAGVAELNVSDHHWRFWRSDGELRLTFLSTFRGNREPTQLVVSSTEANTIRFHAPELRLLTLSVTLAEPNVDIRVFHHQKPHVYIRLSRSNSSMKQAELPAYIEKSCKLLE